MRAKPVERRVADVIDVVKGVDLVERPEAWGDLDTLSSNTHVDAIEVDPAGVIISGQHFRGVANVYVVLEYGGGQEPGGFTTSDAFLGKFEGHFDAKGNPFVDEFKVDTSPFFAGEDVAAEAQVSGTTVQNEIDLEMKRRELNQLRRQRIFEEEATEDLKDAMRKARSQNEGKT